jgi:hypothetical protein
MPGFVATFDVHAERPWSLPQFGPYICPQWPQSSPQRALIGFQP